jgi:hypothetical protein
MLFSARDGHTDTAGSMGIVTLMGHAAERDLAWDKTEIGTVTGERAKDKRK